MKSHFFNIQFTGLQKNEYLGKCQKYLKFTKLKKIDISDYFFNDFL